MKEKYTFSFLDIAHGIRGAKNGDTIESIVRRMLLEKSNIIVQANDGVVQGTIRAHINDVKNKIDIMENSGIKFPIEIIFEG